MGTLHAIRRTELMTFPHRLHVMFAFGVGLVATTALIPFFGFHFQLMLLNQTTLEFLKRRDSEMDPKNGSLGTQKKESYSRGSAIENYSEVCGPPSFLVRSIIESI